MLENQHRLIQLLQQNTIRSCSTGSRLQPAVVEEEPFFPEVKSVDSSNEYYPTDRPFVHAPDVGDQFKVREFLFLFPF